MKKINVNFLCRARRTASFSENLNAIGDQATVLINKIFCRVIQADMREHFIDIFDLFLSSSSFRLDQQLQDTYNFRFTRVPL